MNFYAISALVNLITGACLCLAILSKEKRNKIDLCFALFAFCACVWSAGYFFWQISAAHDVALFWVRFLIAGAIGIGITYLHFVFEFLNLSNEKQRLLRALDVLFAAFFIADFTPAVVKTVEARLQFTFWPVPGLAFHIFLISWLLCIFYSTSLLYKTYLVSQGIFKKQVKTLLWGVSIGFVAGSFNYLLWYNIPIPPVTNILVSLYFILVFYAIVRYKFFNIKVIATEAFVLLLLGTSIWQLFTPDISRNVFLSSAFISLVLVAGIFLIRSVVLEVTQRERLQELSKKLADANEQLKALDKARAEFISIASHQLRTPPATIKWYLAAMLGGDFGPVSDKLKQALTTAEMTNNSMISLIDDLLNASRIERGKMEFIFEPTDLLKITQLTIDQLMPQALQKKQKLTFHPTKPGAIPEVNADKEKLRQVVNNFIDNAIKYSPTGGVIDVTISKTDKDIVVKVKDNGRGILPDSLNTVFEKYNRGGTKTDSQGLGLGLYVAKVVVEQHQGKIWAESEGEGKGSTFCLSLPIQSNLKASTFDLAKK
jgi:signal transduction histidine kinase